MADAQRRDPRPTSDRQSGLSPDAQRAGGGSPPRAIPRRRFLKDALLAIPAVPLAGCALRGERGPAAPDRGRSAAGRGAAAPHRERVAPPARQRATAAASQKFSPTCVLQDRAWLGIHYTPGPTITLEGQDAVINKSGGPPIPIGATAWSVYDLRGDKVGAGTMAATDTTITVCRSGRWVGGSTVRHGYFTVVTDSGRHGTVVGNTVICPPTRLYQPNPAGDQPHNLSAWLGGANDRDYYSIPEWTPSQLVAQRRTDKYFAGPQDPARPRKLWIASGAQATYPRQSPTPAQWAAAASALAKAGFRGAYYECPTNEPENGGWSISAIIAYWEACRASILAADPSAHVMGWCSGGIYNSSSIQAVAAFLARTHPAAFTNHMENSHQNMSNIVALRQYFGGLKSQFVASNRADLDLWLTETGISGGQYGVLHPRREVRQRTLLRFVAESFGWAKENCYDFPVFDHHGSGLPTYLVDVNGGNSFGNLRAGAYGLHVMAEALQGTSCSPAHPPRRLSFGPGGSVGDALFAGTHYRGAERDVVVLATNGIESAAITLEVSATGSVVSWDGMGAATTHPVSGGQVTVPVDDLLTYVFLPSGTAVSVVDTDQGAVSFSMATNLARGATVLNESHTAVPSVHNGSFGENESGIPGVNPPYRDSTIPSTLTATRLGGSAGSHTVDGFALMTSGPAWQQAGCSLTSFDVTVDGGLVYSYRCRSATHRDWPSASNGNSSDICTMTTWWTSPFAWVRKLDRVPADQVALEITATGYGGEPDRASSQDPTSAYHENDPMQVQLSEFQVY